MSVGAYSSFLIARLTVTGTRETEKKDDSEKYYVYERSYGSFTRSFTLPQGVEADKVNAELKEGVLTLLVPRAAGTQPKRIAVKA